ncbi:hypothetical protein DES36_12628 [Alkalibaculum bacchi]|uniref:Copper chaperone CopZ n=1 Tax=Alkalibaculum bacchi TaxID=645887 RepID=A0A366HYJ6_9FIRM|nr:hypothetical protein [Alkalibaculum bacchi]RBP57956.1 hypothetical protein DES36_12628 [Alkalibaculum bacchi]
MKKTRLCIDGIVDKETQDRVIHQLYNMNGIREAQLSSDKQAIEVIYDEKTSSEEINNHLQNNGYKIFK